MAGVEGTAGSSAADAAGHLENDDAGQQQSSSAEIDQLLALDKSLTPPYQYDAITKLDLFQCNLTSLPSSLPEALPNLSILFCMKNKFTAMPAVIGKCPKLQMVSFKSNMLTSIHPDALGPQMRWLILTDNQLEALPPTIGQCIKLQKLMLSGNLVTSLPDEIEDCTNLELVRLASNKLVEPPMKVLQLPNLAWIALSGNPFLEPVKTKFEEKNKAASSLPVLDEPELDDPNVGEVLGTGASGITHKKYHNDEHVAVKTYVGQITSDGNPEEERKISLVASSLKCDCLINVLGQTAGKGSLVMEYLENYTALSCPPSLESCSRDVYADDATITPDDAVEMVSGLLDALAKLHSNGICHGDFYGHNILIPPNGSDGTKKAKLSDFGAAFMYDKRKKYGNLIEFAEKRAFARLVMEICALLEKSDDEDAAETVKLLADLSHVCLSSSLDTFEFLNLKWKGLKAWYSEGKETKN